MTGNQHTPPDLGPFAPDRGETPASFPAQAVVTDQTRCNRCGYTLLGLPVTGACPECGGAIAESLRGRLLEHASPEYLAKIHRGIFIAELCAAWPIGLLFGGLLLALLEYALGTNLPGFPGLEKLLNLGLGLASVLGWWQFSTPDPALVDLHNDARSRRVLRGALIVMVSCALLEFVFDITASSSVGGSASSVASSAAELIGAIAMLVQFIASMGYLKWLAPRIPDRDLYFNARRYQWLLPVVFVAGIPCLLLGPLIAWCLYLATLDRVRSAIKSIRRFKSGREFKAGREVFPPG